MKYTITEISGKQFWLELGKYYNLNNIPIKCGKKILFQRTIVLNNYQKIRIGRPYLKTIKIKGRLLEHICEKKKILYKMNSKKKTRKKKGNRQRLSRILIEEIFTKHL